MAMASLYSGIQTMQATEAVKIHRIIPKQIQLEKHPYQIYYCDHLYFHECQIWDDHAEDNMLTLTLTYFCVQYLM
jgi:hypothetical protein